MWERAEYQNGDVQIQTKLLDLAVAFATDDALVNRFVREIPTTKPYSSFEDVDQVFQKLG